MQAVACVVEKLQEGRAPSFCNPVHTLWLLLNSIARPHGAAYRHQGIPDRDKKRPHIGENNQLQRANRALVIGSLLRPIKKQNTIIMAFWILKLPCQVDLSHITRARFACWRKHATPKWHFSKRAFDAVRPVSARRTSMAGHRPPFFDCFLVLFLASNCNHHHQNDLNKHFWPEVGKHYLNISLNHIESVNWMLVVLHFQVPHLVSRARKKRDFPFFFLRGDPVQNRPHNPAPVGCLFSTRKSRPEVPERGDFGEENCPGKDGADRAKKRKKGCTKKGVAAKTLGGSNYLK